MTEAAYARMVRDRPLAAVLTLGCKLNLADSEEIARGLRAAGYDVVDRVCEADAFVVNTCSVTHVADAKSRGLIRSVRRLVPGAAVAVTGCYPRSAGLEAARALGADLVVGTRDHDKAELIAFLGTRPERPPAGAAPESRLHARQFVKAQEGCNDVCAFCIVPRTRGREESRSIDRVCAEIEQAVEGGAREVVITGTQLGAWGRDLNPLREPQHLISGILEGTEIARVRFSSLQPQDITAGLLALWEDPRLMPHFHLALQSGSDAVLQRMRRRYSVQAFREAAERIRAAVPGAALTTDVIAGFPGESADDFEATLDFCGEIGFSRIHCFPYSRRSNTGAAAMTGQIPHAVIATRMKRLLALAALQNERWRQRALGKIVPVLWERERTIEGNRVWCGHTDAYLPVYGAGEALRNRITPVYPGALYHDGVWGYSPGEVR